MKQYRVISRSDVIACREGVYQSFPGLTYTASGDLLMGWRQARARPGERCHGDKGDFFIMRETAGHWSQAKLLYTHESDAEEMGCGDLTRISNGRIYLFSRQWDSSRNQTRAVYIAASDDDGHSFAPRRLVDLAEFPYGWSPYGKIIELPDGQLLCGVYGRRAGEVKSTAAMIASGDSGQTWSLYSWIATGENPDGLNYYEPLAALLPNGKINVLLRTNAHFYRTLSIDGGKSWSKPAKSFEGMAGANLVLSTGELMVTYRGIQEHDAGGKPPNVSPRSGHLYNWRISGDGGKSWSPEGEIDTNTAYQIGSYGMGDLVELPNGRVRVIYYTSDQRQCPWLQETILEEV